MSSIQGKAGLLVLVWKRWIDCRAIGAVLGFIEVGGILMLNFHVGGLIVSCGWFWWFGGSTLGVGCK